MAWASAPTPKRRTKPVAWAYRDWPAAREAWAAPRRSRPRRRPAGAGCRDWRPAPPAWPGTRAPKPAHPALQPSRPDACTRRRSGSKPPGIPASPSARSAAHARSPRARSRCRRSPPKRPARSSWTTPPQKAPSRARHAKPISFQPPIGTNRLTLEQDSIFNQLFIKKRNVFVYNSRAMKRVKTSRGALFSSKMTTYLPNAEVRAGRI